MPGTVGTLVGVATDSGHPLTTTITCTGTMNATEQLHLCWLTNFNSGSSFQTLISAVSDSRGGTWALFSTFADALPLVGGTDAFYYDGVLFHDFLIGTFLRVAGTTLVAGDTITATYGTHKPDFSILIAQCFDGVDNTAVNQNFGTYGSTVPIDPSHTFLTYSNGAPGYDAPLWRVDYAGQKLNPACADDCAFIGLFAAHSGSSFVPDQTGTVVQEVTNGPWCLSITFKGLATADGVCIEPGGAFSVPPSHNSTSGNYQFVKLVTPTPPPPRCKKCGGILGGVSVGSTFTRWV